MARNIIGAIRHGGKACFICVSGGGTGGGRVIVAQMKSCCVKKFDFKHTNTKRIERRILFHYVLSRSATREATRTQSLFTRFLVLFYLWRINLTRKQSKCQKYYVINYVKIFHLHLTSLIIVQTS